MSDKWLLLFGVTSRCPKCGRTVDYARFNTETRKVEYPTCNICNKQYISVEGK